MESVRGNRDQSPVEARAIHPMLGYALDPKRRLQSILSDRAGQNDKSDTRS